MKIFTTFCCAALVMASAIYAQSTTDHMTVHFSAPVMVGETRLPAGDCDIQVKRGSSDTTILILRSQAGPSIAAIVSRMSENDTDAEGNASVVFTRRGNDLQLARVLFGDRTGYLLYNGE